MFEVPNFEAWKHSFTHMVERESVKVNVEQAAVSVLESVLHFGRLQPHFAKFSGQAGVLIASQFQGFYKVSRTTTYSLAFLCFIYNRFSSVQV